MICLRVLRPLGGLHACEVFIVETLRDGLELAQERVVVLGVF